MTKTFSTELATLVYDMTGQQSGQTLCTNNTLDQVVFAAIDVWQFVVHALI